MGFRDDRKQIPCMVTNEDFGKMPFKLGPKGMLVWLGTREGVVEYFPFLQLFTISHYVLLFCSYCH